MKSKKPTIAELEKEKQTCSTQRRQEIQAYLDYIYYGRKL